MCQPIIVALNLFESLVVALAQVVLPKVVLILFNVEVGVVVTMNPLSLLVVYLVQVFRGQLIHTLTQKECRTV